MFIILLILFLIPLSGLAWTYVGFPLYMKWKNKNNTRATRQDYFPDIAIVIAAHNEVKVIAQKLESIIQSDYPKDKFQVYIGSDCSTDGTNDIIAQYASKHAYFHFQAFSERQGKIQILNHLMTQVTAPITIFTDANVYFDSSMIRKVVQHFNDEKIGLVGVEVTNTGIRNDGISEPESAYISGETMLKHYEGNVYGSMMGPFGACFAMRTDAFNPIPAGFIVDDFYLCMCVYEQGFHGIVDINAVCYEDVSNDPQEEFRRKKRISIGNFQNLKRFRHFVFKGPWQVSFPFWSHKILRWIGPYLMIGMLCIALLGTIIINGLNMFTILFLGQILFYSIVMADYLFSKINVHIRPFRIIYHFVMMNVALLLGHWAYLSGNFNTVWKPTARNI